MTIQPVAPPHLLGYAELVEGRLLMSPGPVGDHNHAGLEMAYQLRPQLPADLDVLPGLDIDLQLAPADAPGTVRRPDLIVVRREARRRQRADGGVIRASEIVVAVEILSPPPS